MKLNISKARGLFRNEARISTMSSWQRGEKAGENHPLLFFPCPPVSALEGPRTIAARVALAFISSHAPRLILIPVRQRDVIRSPLDPCDNSSDSGLGFDNVDVQLSVRHAPGHLEREVSTPDSLRPWPEEVSIWTERTPRGRSLRQKPEAAAWGRSLRGNSWLLGCSSAPSSDRLWRKLAYSRLVATIRPWHTSYTFKPKYVWL